MARKLTPENEKKVKFATELIKQKDATRLGVHLAVKKKFKSILSKRLMDQVFKGRYNTSGATSGRFSSAKVQLANAPKTLPPIKVPKGTKVIDVGLKRAWAEINVNSSILAEIPDGLRKLLIMVRAEMVKSDVCDLNMDEDGNLEMTIKQVRHVNARLPEPVVTY